MCVDMSIDMRAQPCIDMSVDMRVVMHSHEYSYEQRHGILCLSLCRLKLKVNHPPNHCHINILLLHAHACTHAYVCMQEFVLFRTMRVLFRLIIELVA